MEQQQIFWYLTRSAALVCWLFAMLSVLSGSLLSSRLLGRRPTVPWLTDIHRGFSWLSVTFLAIHMLTLLADPFVKFGMPDLLVPGLASVPGLSDWSLTIGVIAAWLMAIVQLSSLAKNRIGQRVWHTIHLLAFGVVILGAVHAVETGSEIDNPIVLALGTSAVAVVLLAVLGRLVRLRQHTTAPIDANPQRIRPVASATPAGRNSPEWNSPSGQYRKPE